MSNTPTESEFDKELVQILSSTRAFYHTAVKDGDRVSITRTNFDDYIDEEKAIAAIKQAVDRHVIGENLRTESLTTSGLINARMAQNRLKDHQRRDLYGGDKK